MIILQEAKSLVSAYFSGSDPFSEVQELVGHFASQRPDVFLKWFSKQEVEDQRVIAQVLADSALFTEGTSGEIFATASLLADVARQFPSALSPQNIQTLEQFISHGDKLSVWLDDEDTEDDEMKDARTRWRFALMLWNVLVAVGSPVASKAFDRFVQQARDPEFVRGITLAKRVHERGPFGF